MLRLSANRRWVIGVTGHRLNRITQTQLDRITPRLRPLLVQLAGHAGDPAPRLVSGLAEGADRHLAELALGAGYLLHAVLPFARDVYLEDFTDAASRSQFDGLLNRASQISELPGLRAFAGQAYRRAGDAILDEADVLIAVWNGLPAQGAGGTAEVVQSACRRRIPVIHVSTCPRTAPVLLWQRRGRAERSGPGDAMTPRPCSPARLAAIVSTLRSRSR